MGDRKLTAYRLSRDAGINEGLIGTWKRGTKKPSMNNLQKLAQYFGVTTDYLLGCEPQENNPESLANKSETEDRTMGTVFGEYEFEIIVRAVMMCISLLRDQHWTMSEIEYSLLLTSEIMHIRDKTRASNILAGKDVPSYEEFMPLADRVMHIGNIPKTDENRRVILLAKNLLSSTKEVTGRQSVSGGQEPRAGGDAY